MQKVCFTCSKTNDFTRIHKTVLPNDTKKMLYKQPKIFNKNLEIGKVKLYKPINARVKIEINLGNLNGKRYLFYFAAKPKTGNQIHFLNEQKAYGNMDNSGLTIIPKDGKVTVYIKCPQNYIDKGLWLPHIHFLISNKDMTKWQPYVYTKLVLCPVEKKFVKKAIRDNNFFLINALPMDEYIKERIPMSFPLPHNVLKKLNDKNIINYIRKMLIHNPSLHKFVHNQKAEYLFKIPIIVYCYKKSCNASHKVIERLWKIGFKNIKIYEGGILDWNRK